MVTLDIITTPTQTAPIFDFTKLLNLAWKVMYFFADILTYLETNSIHSIIDDLPIIGNILDWGIVENIASRLPIINEPLTNVLFGYFIFALICISIIKILT